MNWDRNDFIAVLKTEIAGKLLADAEVAAYVKGWSEDHKAALMHANNITANSDFSAVLPQLQLVAAFARKDEARIEYLLQHEKVSTGVRLDYLLPLYDEKYHAGEDIFVASVKALLNGDVNSDIHINSGRMVHQVGASSGQDYTDDELRGIEGYVNNSHRIRQLLKAAPNKSVIQPNRSAVDYILRNAATYRDTNNNPVIVFIPGAISIEGRDVPALIDDALAHGANINDVGFFGVPGIVWSIILADVAAVKQFLQRGARVDIQDEMRNATVLPWVTSTSEAAIDDAAYIVRLSHIRRDISAKLISTLASEARFFKSAYESRSSSDEEYENRGIYVDL